MEMPQYESKPFSRGWLRDGTMLIQKQKTPQDVEKAYNAVKEAVTSFKYNENASEDDLQKLKDFARGRLDELEK